MKRVINLIVCFAIIISVQGQNKKEIKLNKIKSVTVWRADNKDNKITNYMESYEGYNKNGKQTSKIEYNKDGAITHNETTIYDSYGNKIEETLSDVKDGKNEKKTYKYNVNNDRTEEVEYNKTGAIVNKTTFTYNANGDKSSEMVYDVSGNLLKKIVYTYGNKKLKESRQTYNSANVLESVKKYVYEYF